MLPYEFVVTRNIICDGSFELGIDWGFAIHCANIVIVVLTVNLDPEAPAKIIIRVSEWNGQNAANEMAAFVERTKISVMTRTLVTFNVSEPPNCIRKSGANI